MKKPIFKHDCKKCEFVRTDTYDKKLSDFIKEGMTREEAKAALEASKSK